ncbi:putative disease resistance RPP13-like protein 1 [Olea europaea var. sylvestris]|uniref:Disease resistance RPP13 1 n=1 Tax=Olea europaea subsp. europaea TaxID=158383 RepID=A0A8S0VF31_OLEEU|nr:putative disease resistance RPP13-like protein 1 [Olea europaea var. sylvestris]XP_022866706.1 putative disease resistance RPP13-like protein 1 [Olea europaea var. sylvestris]XP_022866713.1 putative disease resistance RPP13-like protein 1 [Olea europaea var. sylvestris]XP_022866718.1 putative disease resistance RPP13-like protein 1 [Olea europaea var. sylvestris]XP_022866722.1 putative disease resistance RPP13-like protein 1 [Olea europaea var. sylvestris]CAA3030856.1 disease resistance RPP
MAIGEVFIGALITVLLEKLVSGDLMKFLHGVGIDSLLKEWHKKLLMMKAVLTDAENKQTSNEAVKEWLKDLEDLAYDLDDLVDELNTEATRRKMKENHEANRPSTSMVRKLIPSCCTNFSFHDFMSDRGMASKLKDISCQLETLMKEISTLELVKNVSERPYRTTERLDLTSVVEESEVYGREMDRENILNMLLGGESSDSPISVLPIVGMGGVGKTTLAQLVYNDDRLKDVFDLKAWACVSDQFNAIMVTKTILKQVSPGSYNDDDLNMLQVKLKQNLSNEKFLLVLDDVWNEYYEDWDILKRPFLASKPGSKIIVTTRQHSVAKIMSHSPAYDLNVLSSTDALSLLAQHALEAKTFDARPDLRDIGKAVVEKCGNLPLALKALGGLLRTMGSPNEWEDVLNSENWMAEDKSKILPSLKLSYQYLRPQLKRCFAYCALFPKDFEFDKSKLVYLWIAEGFLQVSQREMLTQVGSKYFDELFARSFFQRSSANASYYVMHDLLNDLATFVDGEKCLRMDDELKENLPSSISENVRHLSFIPHEYEMYQRFNFLKKVRSLRTFLPLPIQQWYPESLFPHKVSLEILPKLHCLRVLSLSGYTIYELPNSIGDLKHLRYLDLAETLLKCLPESVSNLINLQVLILRGCYRLTKLPASMENLINLFYLDIAGTDELNEMPQGIAQLKSLQTLPKMIVSKSSGRLKDLRNLSLLQGKISIEELQNVVNVQEAIDARLRYNPSLTKVRLAWSGKLGDSRNEILELDVLNALEPHYNLKSLKIVFYGGSKFPNWIGDLSFSKLEKISFHCGNCTTLPSLGQLPSLRELSIAEMGRVKVIGAEFYGDKGSFPALERLTFEDMPDWEEWLGLTHEVEGGVRFPQLSKLCMRRCPKLVKLPIPSLPSLCELSIKGMDRVKVIGAEFYGDKGPFPALERLTIENMPDWEEWLGLTHEVEGIVRFPQLSKLYIRRCPKLVKLPIPSLPSLCELSIEGMDRVKVIGAEFYGDKGPFPTLERLTIEDMPDWEEWLGLTHEVEGVIRFPQLSKLCIRQCPKLVKLPILSLPSLRELQVKACNEVVLSHMHNLESLTQLNLEKIFRLTSVSKAFMQFPFALENLEVRDCNDLETLWPSDRIAQSLVNLRRLFVNMCPKLLTLRDIDALPVLRDLCIQKCESLELVPNSISCLKKLEIRNCSSLKTMMKLQDCNTSLEFLLVEKRVNFNLTNLLGSVHNYTSLHWLRIYSCDGLESFPPGGLPTPNLKILHIDDCQQLKSLPDRMELISSLEKLSVSRCPLLVEPFPQRKFPPNMTVLSFYNCGNLKPLGGWGLHKITSLEMFKLRRCYPELVSFSNDDNDDDNNHLLPPSIRILTLSDLPNLESLSKDFQNLTSLRHLYIYRCQKLVALPMEDQLDRLWSLHIEECPLLKKRCLKNKGDYWKIIADIPVVRIDGCSVHDPDQRP